jgi:hypothetical protein
MHSPQRLEIWEATNRRDKRYFLREEEGRYLFGINPELVPPELEQEILKLLQPVYGGG